MSRYVDCKVSIRGHMCLCWEEPASWRSSFIFLLFSPKFTPCIPPTNSPLYFQLPPYLLGPYPLWRYCADSSREMITLPLWYPQKTFPVPNHTELFQHGGSCCWQHEAWIETKSTQIAWLWHVFKTDRMDQRIICLASISPWARSPEWINKILLAWACN